MFRTLIGRTTLILPISSVEVSEAFQLPNISLVFDVHYYSLPLPKAKM